MKLADYRIWLYLSITLTSALVITGQPPSGMMDGSASVVLFRPNNIIGFAVAPPVECDGKRVAKMQNGRYITLHLSPGPHVFITHRSNGWKLPIDVEAGKTYFVSSELSVNSSWKSSEILNAGGVPHKGYRFEYKRDGSKETLSSETFDITPTGKEFVLTHVEPTAAKKMLKHMKPASKGAVAKDAKVSLAKLAIP